jgi:hypothetical protein
MKTHIKIVDSVNRPFRKEGSARKVKGYRVQLIAGNGEMLQHSEQLESVAAVKKHIEALGKVFALTHSGALYTMVKIKDATAAKIWTYL